MPGNYDSIYTGPQVDEAVRRFLEGEAVTIDSAMSNSSSNVVQNKVLKKYIDDAIDDLINPPIVIVYAFIDTTFTPGDLVVATNGEETISSDTSGHYVFNVHEPGEWVLTAQTSHATETITVDTEGIVYTSDLTVG